MLTDNFRKQLRQQLVNQPKQAVKEIQKNPQILKFLLDSEEQKIKYIKMNQELEDRLQNQADRLNVTQGWLIGAGLLLLLGLLDDR